MSNKVIFESNPDHAPVALWVVWEALGRALEEIGKLTGSIEHVASLRNQLIAPFLGELTEQETGQGIMHPEIARHLKSLEPAAINTGIEAVDAAISRIKQG
ncbi:hypothetical protein [Paracoccus sp. (in: a-proteobacteria)]|uniref:hypothetical protein n=1 Tax=Paracoccus sp. TaxID=267 RepID=UPI00289CC612|nr:hypothetical protein [Paracoccus sp. (in: a-proteobacteria)]